MSYSMSHHHSVLDSSTLHLFQLQTNTVTSSTPPPNTYAQLDDEEKPNKKKYVNVSSFNQFRS